jgi:hypothetical protein
MKVQFDSKKKELIIRVPVDVEGHESKSGATKQYAFASSSCILPWIGKAGKIKVSAYETLGTNEVEVL